MEFVMRNDGSIGVLYDAVYTCILHFNGENTEQTAAILGEREDLPRLLAPFFVKREALTPPILSYLKENIHSCGSIDKLTEALSEDEGQDMLRRNVCNVLFYPDHSSLDGCHAECSMKMAQRLDRTDYSADFKYQALLCLTYFRHAVSELCRALVSLKESVEALHDKYESETDAVFAAMRAGRYDRLYLHSAELDLGIFNEITVSFSILHPELLLPCVTGKQLILLVGSSHADGLIRDFDESQIDLGIFLDDIGNELRRMILETLSGQSEMTASDISRQTGIPVTTALRHMEALCDHYLIRVSHRKGLQIFYTLNREYLCKARMKTDKYLFTLGGDIIEERDEGNTK